MFAGCICSDPRLIFCVQIISDIQFHTCETKKGLKGVSEGTSSGETTLLNEFSCSCSMCGNRPDSGRTLAVLLNISLSLFKN